MLTWRTLRAAVSGAFVLLCAAQPATARAADALTIHDKAAIQVTAYRFFCIDCDGAPNWKAARWRFASDFRRIDTYDGYAYVSVVFRTFAGDAHGMLFGFTALTGRWQLKGRSLDGTNRFRCGSDVLLNQNAQLERQLRLLRKVARCP